MLTILMGMSGSGKDTVQTKLVDEYAFERIVPVTTRPIREGETNGIDYHFVSKDEFTRIIEQNRFIEYRSYNTLVNGKPDTWYYGSLKQDLDPDKDYCIILDVQGTKDFVEHYGKENCFVTEITVRDDVREQRAASRGSFDKTEWDRRLADDHKKFAPDKTESVINFTIDNTYDNLEETVLSILDALDAYVTYEREDGKQYVVQEERHAHSYWEPPEITYRVYDMETLKAIRLQEETFTLKEDLAAYFEYGFEAVQGLPAEAFSIDHISVEQNTVDNDCLLTAIVNVIYDDGVSGNSENADFTVTLFSNETVSIHLTEMTNNAPANFLGKYENSLVKALTLGIHGWTKESPVFRKLKDKVVK